jgi:hypothetical protein
MHRLLLHACGVPPVLCISLKNALRAFFKDMHKCLLSTQGAKSHAEKMRQRRASNIFSKNALRAFLETKNKTDYISHQG